MYNYCLIVFPDHPNIKCYLGHGGNLGISEAVYVGLPMILIPMFGDQFHNSAAVKTRGAGIVLSFHDLSEQSLKHALDACFNDTRYVVLFSFFFNRKMRNMLLVFCLI